MSILWSWEDVKKEERDGEYVAVCNNRNEYMCDYNAEDRSVGFSTRIRGKILGFKKVVEKNEWDRLKTKQSKRKELTGKMTVRQILQVSLGNGWLEDNAIVVIRHDFEVLACEYWYKKDIFAYLDYEAESFTWQNNNRVSIDLKPLKRRRERWEEDSDLYW